MTGKKRTRTDVPEGAIAVPGLKDGVGIWQGSRAGRPSVGDGKGVAKGMKVRVVDVVV